MGTLKGITLIMLLVMIHEWGHKRKAASVGIKTKIFSIGFGPTLIKKTYKDTEYRVSLLPLGGYVSFDYEGTKGGRAYNDLKPQEQIKIFFGGVWYNIITYVVIAIILVSVVGYKGNITKEEYQGIPAESIVLGVYGEGIELDMQGGPYKVLDEAERISVEYIPKISGIYGKDVKTVEYENYEQLQGIEYRVVRGGVLACIKAIVTSKMPHTYITKGPETKQVETKELRGVVGIVGIVQYISETEDIYKVLNILGVLSLSLAVINMIPIPGLDGWHILTTTLLAMLMVNTKVGEKIKEYKKQKEDVGGTTIKENIEKVCILVLVFVSVVLLYSELIGVIQGK